MPEIVASVLCVFFILLIMWIGVFGQWNRRIRHNELMTIWERFRELKPDEMKEYYHYENSFFLIAKGGKNGKKNAFESAYTIGYLTGKGESKHE